MHRNVSHRALLAPDDIIPESLCMPSAPARIGGPRTACGGADVGVASDRLFSAHSASQRRTDTMVTIATVPAPRGSLIAQALPKSHYVDAYRVLVSAATPPDLDTLARAIFAVTPTWVVTLLRLRNALVQPFGLKTAPPTPAGPASSSLQPGAVLGIFRVYARGDDELVLGDNDRHLDFRVGILREREGAWTAVTVCTAVCFHSWFGRLYFVPVQPFHRLIVPALMRRAAHQLGDVPG
jgi:hypothetical protein